MPTSVHLPRELLAAVDRRARALKISRNKLIVHALETEVAKGEVWSAGFFEALSPLDQAGQRTIHEMSKTIEQRRSSKRPPDL